MLTEMQDTFRTFSQFVARAVGSGWMFLTAVLLVITSGYYFRFSEAWKLNAGLAATVTSLLILILLQRSQNHNDKATHIKLDELINAIEGARNEAASVEDQPEKDMDRLKESNPAEGNAV
jgi:low affinity Fe/Cu permease